MKKWLLPALYLSGLAFAFLYRHPLLGWMENSGPAAAFAAATALALFPVVPYKAVIALFGYVYGPLAGAVICWTATTAASALMYGAVRIGFRDQARAYLASVPSLDRFTSALEKRPFAAVVVGRLLPVIPQAAVNVYAAAAGFPFWSFMAATGIGKIPGISLFAFLGGSALSEPWQAVTAVLLYAAVLGAAYLSLKRRETGDGGNNPL